MNQYNPKKDRMGRIHEIRAVTIEPTADGDDMIIEGRAVVYNSETVLWKSPETGIEYKEVIARGALDNADMNDVPLRYNHSDDFTILARTRNGSLKLIPDEKGLKIWAKLAPTTTGKDIYTLIRDGYIDKMSFAFTIADSDFDSLTNTRTIKRIDKLYDVAVVDVPVYDETSVSARAAGERLEAKVKKATEEEKRKRLMLLTYC